MNITNNAKFPLHLSLFKFKFKNYVNKFIGTFLQFILFIQLKNVLFGSWTNNIQKMSFLHLKARKL